MLFFQTRNIESAARDLFERYERVFVRGKTALFSPIRFRRRRLADLNPYIVMNPKEFTRQLEAWNEKGGMLIYERSWRAYEKIAAHHAQLVVECPLSVMDLERYLDGTREVAVVYRPPNWDEHHRGVDALFPTAERCQRFYELVRGCDSRTDVEKVLGKTGFTICSDEWAMAGLGLTAGQLVRVRAATYRHLFVDRVTQVVTRVEPVGDPVLAKVYRFIESEFPETASGVRLIPGEALLKAHRWWRVALRDMKRAGAIDWRETLYCYTEDALPPPWNKIQGNHLLAKKRLAEVIAKVEEAPDYSAAGEAVESMTRAAD